MSKLTYTKYLGRIDCQELLHLLLHFLFCASSFGLCIQVQAEQSSQKQETKEYGCLLTDSLEKLLMNMGPSLLLCPVSHQSQTSACLPPIVFLLAFCIQRLPVTQNLLSHVFSIKICSKVSIFSLYSYVLSLIFLPFKSSLYCDEKLCPFRNCSSISIQWTQKAQFRGLELGRH